MADETLNIGPDEANAAEPEVTEQPAGGSPPEAAAPEPEQAETAGPGMEEPSAGEPPGEEHEPDAPRDTPPQEVDTPEAEQPEVDGAVVEDAPPLEPLPGDDPAVEPPAAEEPEPPAPGNDGEVVVPFDKISELIAIRNREARAAIEQEEAVTPQPEGMDKSPEEPAQEEPAPKRQNRSPKEKRPEHEEKADKPRRGGRKPKEATQDKDDPSGKVRDKVSRGKRGKAAPERDTPGGGAAAGAPAVEVDTPTADVEAAFGLKDATRATKEEVVYLDLSELHAFKDHPFKVREDTEMQSLVESVKTGGVNQPALVRPREGGGYEIIAGHRRQKASELAGFRNMPCIVREMTDDEAILAMTDDNLRHRDHILLTEKAKALQQQVDAISHRGVRLQNVAEGDIGKRSTEIVGARNGLNYKKVMRLIRLNYLVQELKDRLDGTAINADGKPAKKIAFTPAVELSYIRPKNQRLIAVSIEGEQASPSLSQAKKLRELDEKGLLNGDVIDGILSEEKKEVDQVIISTEELNKYFGKEVTPRQMKDQIIALLDEWKEKQPPEKKAELEK